MFFWSMLSTLAEGNKPLPTHDTLKCDEIDPVNISNGNKGYNHG